MRSNPGTNEIAETGVGVGGPCPGCEPALQDPDWWSRFHTYHHETREARDVLRGQLAEARVGLASFENLFRIAPIPIMEQDYTHVAEWMDGLREQGVTDIRDYLGNDMEAVRSVISMIWIVAANPAAVEAVGLPHADLIGPIDPSIANEESLTSWLAQLEAVWNCNPEARASFVAATPDGRTYDAESTLAAPVIDGEPDFSRAVFTIVDVTQHRDEERRMEDLIAAKSQFLASVSHEIRTPLTAIVGFGQLLEDESMDADDRQTMVTSLVAQAHEVADLVEDLLVAARAEAGQVNVDSVEFEVLEHCGRTLAAGGSYTSSVRFDRGADEALLAVGDPARVRQVLRNLLTNAERYGGPDVSVVVSADDGWVHVDVVDDGVGLPPDQWESIFDLYHRAGNLSRPESIGIGLTVSRQLAELMGGSLVYSREGEFSRFRLSLRAAGKASPSVGSAEPI